MSPTNRLLRANRWYRGLTGVWDQASDILQNGSALLIARGLGRDLVVDVVLRMPVVMSVWVGRPMRAQLVGGFRSAFSTASSTASCPGGSSAVNFARAK